MADTSPETRHDAMTIRGVRADDAAAIAEIYRPIVETTVISFELVPPDAGEIARRIEATLEAGYPYLVAERDGAVTGYAYAARFRGRAAYDGTAETSIYVRRDVKRGGVGRALMTALEDRLREAGYRMMVAGMSGEDAEPSVRFHAALGFTLTGEIPAAGVKFGAEHKLTFMWKRL